MKHFITCMSSVIAVFALFSIISCARSSNTNDNESDSISTESYDMSDAETEDAYGDSPDPDWHFEVLVKEDALEYGEEASLYAGGWKYDGITITTTDGYASYSNQQDYQWYLPLFYMVCRLASEFSTSGETYPSKAEWKQFQSEVLDPLRQGGDNWENIQNKKWRKEAGDIYYSLENTDIKPLDRTADWQSYYYEIRLGSTRQKRIIIKGLPENNSYNLPEGTIAMMTLTW